QQLRKLQGITSSRKWNTLACADAAELTGHYRTDYFHFSGHTHATTGGIIMQESAAGAGYVLQSLLFILACSVAYAVQVLPTASPQLHMDTATKLLKEITDLVESGVFRKVD